jgi:arylsulfatase A-like enzyme
MLEKWHCAYQEVLHVPFVVSSPLVNRTRTMQTRDGLSSHVDVLPTLLGLAGLDARELQRNISGKDAPLPVGSDLSAYIHGRDGRIVEPDGQERAGVLFVTDDCITEPMSPQEGQADTQYAAYLQAVRRAISDKLAPIAPGSVMQPAHVQAVVTREWKFVRYWDPLGNATDEFELYCLAHDPREEWNLVGWSQGLPVVKPAAIPTAWGLSAAEVERKLSEMQALLAHKCKTLLSTPPSSSE